MDNLNMNIKSALVAPWNGTGYYQAFYQSETVRFKIDSLYTQNADGGCGVRPVEYYVAKGLDFALVRLDEKSYYIIKEKII